MNKFNSHKQFETHALKKVIGRKFYLNNITDDGQVGKIAEEKLFGKVAAPGQADYFIKNKAEELKVYSANAIHILTSKSKHKIKQKAADKMRRSSLLYYEKSNNVVTFKIMYRLFNMNEKLFKKRINIRKNKHQQFEVNITLKRLEESFDCINEVA